VTFTRSQDLSSSRVADRTFAGREIKFLAKYFGLVEPDVFYTVKAERTSNFGDTIFVAIPELDAQLDSQPESSEAVPRVENGELDVSKYTPEQLQQVEGIEVGTILRNVPFVFREGVDNPDTYISKFEIGGRRTAFFAGEEPPFSGPAVGDLRVVNVGNFLLGVLASSGPTKLERTEALPEISIDAPQAEQAAQLRNGLKITGVVFDKNNGALSESASKLFAGKQIQSALGGAAAKFGVPYTVEIADFDSEFQGDTISVKLVAQESAIPESIPRVENGELDVSKYTPEQLQQVEGIEAGTILRNVPFEEGVFPYTRRQTYVSKIKINGEVVCFFVDVEKPNADGVYDVRFGRSQDFKSFVEFAPGESADRPQTDQDEAEADFEISQLFDDIPAQSERVVVGEEQLANEPRHVEMLKHQAQMLRRPAIQASLQLARKAMHGRSTAVEVLRRATDMRVGEEAGEKHRRFTALGSALYQDRNAYQVFNAGIDTQVEHSTDRIQNWLENWEGAEPPLVPSIVIGTGPHGATFLSTLAMYAPEIDPLVVDQRQRIGGQFADAEQPVFRLNSRNRPQLEGEDREARNLPGTEQTINPLGSMATLQVSDVSGESYVTQDVLAHATRFNAATATENFATQFTIVGTETVRRSDGVEVTRCSFLDTQRNQLHTIDTDSLTIAGGIGKDAYRFAERDFITDQNLQVEKQKLERGERATVMSFPEMISWWGNPDVSSPLKGVETAVISGTGDSANVAAGILLGYEPGANRMPVAIDRVKTLYWIGQNIPSKEQWLDQVRARYAQVGLEFPREEIESYYARIVPVPETKVTDVIVSGDEVIVTNDDGPEIEADIYIGCNGFQNDTPDVLAGSAPGSRFETTSATYEEFLKPGAYARSADGTNELRIIGRVQDGRGEGFEFIVANNGVVQERGFTGAGDDEGNLRIKLFNFEDAGAVFSIPSGDTPYEELFDDDGFPIARRVQGSGVLLTGPAADLTVSDEEKERAPVLQQIPENTAALFRYGRGGEKGARLVAKELQGKKGREYDMPEGVPVTTLVSTGEQITAQARVRSSDIEKANKYHIDNQAALQLSLADYLENLRFPGNLRELEIAFTGDPYSSTQVLNCTMNGLAVQGLNGTAATNPVEDVLQSIVSDEMVTIAVARELAAHNKKIKGQDFVANQTLSRATAAVNQNRSAAEKVEVGGGRSDQVTLSLRIPVKGARADVQSLELVWE